MTTHPDVGNMPFGKLHAFEEALDAKANAMFGWHPEAPEHPTREDLKTMTPDQVAAAHEAGRLDHILNGDTNA